MIAHVSVFACIHSRWLILVWWILKASHPAYTKKWPSSFAAYTYINVCRWIDRASQEIFLVVIRDATQSKASPVPSSGFVSHANSSDETLTLKQEQEEADAYHRFQQTENESKHFLSSLSKRCEEKCEMKYMLTRKSQTNPNSVTLPLLPLFGDFS